MDPEGPGSRRSVPSNTRLASLDAFRGFTIAAMILVNNPGDWGHVYAQLQHARWHGWTFTDWIFPHFLFICGVAMAFSLQRRAGEGADRGALVRGLVRRGAIIFAIGLALNLVPAFDLATLRIPGVLQRIGLCIALAAPIVAYSGWRGVSAAIAALFALYSLLMLCVPTPGPDGEVHRGVLEPGYDTGAFVDRVLMGGHLWSQSVTWDPEGLVSTATALASLLFGVLAGRGLLAQGSPGTKAAWMALAGALAAYLGLVLDATFMPINKSLWTVSYSVFMTGLALLLFAAFYWLIDAARAERIRRASRAAALPFTIYGMNALFIFAFASLTARMLAAIKVHAIPLKAWLYAPIAALPVAPVNASLLYAIAFDLAMFALAWLMWRRGWFVKV